MLDEDEFQALIDRIRAGDANAANECVQMYEAEIRRAARIRLTDPKLRRVIDSIDICQSVFGRFFQRAADGKLDLESPERLLALLITMTRNRVIDEHRRQTAAKRPPIGDPLATVDNLVEDSDGPRTVAAAKEMLSEIRSRLSSDELDVADRRNAGQSWEEIATSLGEPADTLRKRLERALKRVREEITVAPAE